MNLYLHEKHGNMIGGWTIGVLKIMKKKFFFRFVHDLILLHPWVQPQQATLAQSQLFMIGHTHL